MQAMQPAQRAEERHADTRRKNMLYILIIAVLLMHGIGQIMPL